MIEMTIAAHDAAEIQVIADAVARIADLRRRHEPELAFERPDTITVAVAEPPAEAPKRRGRPPKSDAATPAASETAPAEPAQPEPVAESRSEPAPALTLEAVRAKAASVSQAGKAAAVKALLTEMGAAKLTDLSADRYPEFIERLEAV